MKTFLKIMMTIKRDSNVGQVGRESEAAAAVKCIEGTE